jgi:hypothetical protein
VSLLGWIVEIAAAVAIIVLIVVKLRPRTRVVASHRGVGAQVVVRDAYGHRELWLVASDGRATLQSRTTLADPLVSGIPYTDGFHLYPPAAGEVLFIGAGAAVAPRQFAEMYPETRVQIVEHDPEVVSVAATHFGLSPSPRLRIEVADGRAALARSDMWSFIAIDAFGAGDFPAQLATVEAFSACRAHLASGGILVVNLAGTLAGPVLRSVRAGIVAAFGAEKVLAFGVPAIDRDPPFHPKRAGNTLVFAFRDGIPNERAGARVSAEAKVRLRFLDAIAALPVGVDADGEPLHDETAPSSLPIE